VALAGLDMLVDHDFVAEQLPPGSPRGGRPKVTYTINPRGRK
jgi:hypothetical protein